MIVIYTSIGVNCAPRVTPQFGAFLVTMKEQVSLVVYLQRTTDLKDI